MAHNAGGTTRPDLGHPDFLTYPTTPATICRRCANAYRGEITGDPSKPSCPARDFRREGSRRFCPKGWKWWPPSLVFMSSRPGAPYHDQLVEMFKREHFDAAGARVLPPAFYNLLDSIADRVQSITPLELLEQVMAEEKSKATDLVAVFTEMSKAAVEYEKQLTEAAEAGQLEAVEQVAQLVAYKAAARIFSPPVVDELWNEFAGTEVGFKTDPQNYSLKQKRDFFIALQMDGVRPTGGEAACVKGRPFACKPFYQRKLTREAPEGFHSLVVQCCGVSMEGDLARVEVVATWIQNGQQQKRTWEEGMPIAGRKFDGRIVVKVDKGQNEPAIKGKAEARAMRDIYRSLLSWEPNLDAEGAIDVDSEPVEEAETADDLAKDADGGQDPVEDPQAVADEQARLYEEWRTMISDAPDLRELDGIAKRLNGAEGLTAKTRDRLIALGAERRKTLQRKKGGASR